MLRSHLVRALVSWALVTACAAACGSGDAPGAAAATGAGGGADAGIDDGCDPIVPTHCALPFPNDLYLVDDPSTKTGKRVAIPPVAVPRADEQEVPPSMEPLAASDGFSSGATLIAHLPGATTEGLATPADIGRSLDAGSPTVILVAETGERVPHFAELDRSHAVDDRRALLLKPVVPLASATRHLIAIRGVKDASGAVIPPSDAFRALRDGLPHPHPSVEARRARYEDLFTRLEKAGVARGDLQLAWEVTTASRESDTSWVLAMRDDALAVVGDAGPAYVIDAIDDDVNEHVARRIKGRMTVPLYLDGPDPGGVLVFGDDGLPRRNGTAEFPFTVLVPRSVAEKGEPAPPLQYGHGLLGSQAQVEGTAIRSFADEFGYVAFAVDWIGMANPDATQIADIIATGAIDRFRQVPDRLTQGLVNALLAMRMMRGAFASDPAVQVNGASVIDTSRGYYMGDSQGGIFGATYMALSTDVTRGVLGVPGQPYSLLLDRSIDFRPFFALMSISYSDPIDRQLLIALAQMLWDRAEPSGFSRYIEHDPLPGTPSHRVLLEVAVGDHQVTTLGAHVMARAIGAKAVAPAVRSIWGVDEVGAPYEGSAIVEYDFGLPPEPLENVPMEAGEDPHGKPRNLPEARALRDAFFRTGAVDPPCDGPCDPD